MSDQPLPFEAMFYKAQNEIAALRATVAALEKERDRFQNEKTLAEGLAGQLDSEVRQLRAACAAKDEALEYVRNHNHNHQQPQLCEFCRQIDYALSTVPAQDFVSLKKSELNEVLELLKRSHEMSYNYKERRLRTKHIINIQTLLNPKGIHQ